METPRELLNRGTFLELEVSDRGAGAARSPSEWVWEAVTVVENDRRPARYRLPQEPEAKRPPSAQGQENQQGLLESDHLLRGDHR